MARSLKAGDCVRFIDGGIVYRLEKIEGKTGLIRTGLHNGWYSLDDMELAEGYNHQIVVNQSNPLLQEAMNSVIGYKFVVKAKQQEPDYQVQQHQPISCRCCGQKASFKLTKPSFCIGNQLGQKAKHNMPDLTGWMVIEYPFRDPRHSNAPEGTNPGTDFKEKSKVCPKCAQKVMGTLVYLATPGASR